MSATTAAAESRRVAAGAGAPPRAAVAVIVSRFPLVTETFILREITEMERQGQPVRLVPLLRERPAVVHPEARAWVPRALYTPFLSPAIVRDNVRVLARDPVRYLSTLARAVVGSLRSGNALAGTLGVFPKAVHLAERLREEGVGHVHAHFATHPAMAAWIVNRLAGIEYSITVHAHDLFRRSSRAMLAEKVRGARFVRVISRFNRAYLARLLPRLVTDEKVPVIHCGVRMEEHPATPAPAGDPRLLCVAALKPYKGLPVLFEACRRLRDARVCFTCDVVGDGPMRAQLERMLRELGLTAYVRLLGARPADEVAALVRDATVVVLPSVVAPDGWMDGIPVALMEAMAAGRPVVASAISGIPELVEHEVDGLLVPPDDPAALTAALERLIGDPAFARALAARAPAKVRDAFRLDDVVATLVDRIGHHAASPAVDRLLGGGARVGGEAAGVRRTHERKDSVVAELLVREDAGVREVVCKAHRDVAGADRDAAARARHEAAVLGRIARAFAPLAPTPDGRRLAVPSVVSLDEATATVVLERCAGQPLDALIRDARGDTAATARLHGALADAGRWLRALQERVAPTDAPLDPARELRQRATRDLSRCADRGMSWPAVGRTRAALERLAAGAAAMPPRAVARHGDYWPGNVFASDDTLGVIDFEGFGGGAPYEDVAYFLVHLELFHAWPHVRRAMPAATAAFLAGWAGGGPVDAPALAVARIAAAAQVLARLPRGGGPAMTWRRRELRRMIASATRPGA